MKDYIWECDCLISPYLISAGTTDTFSYEAVKVAIDYFTENVEEPFITRVIRTTPTKGVCMIAWPQDNEILDFTFIYSKEVE